MHAAYLLAFIFPSSKHTPSCTLTTVTHTNRMKKTKTPRVKKKKRRKLLIKPCTQKQFYNPILHKSLFYRSPVHEVHCIFRLGLGTMKTVALIPTYYH